MTNGVYKKRAWKSQELKAKDKFMPRNEAWETDIIIPVMGQTGVGKSTFINTLLGTSTMSVGDDLDRCTANLQYSIIPDIPNHPKLKGHRIVVVDTPGFNDENSTEDSEILKRIAAWLASSYKVDMKLGGMVYLHDISQTRMPGATRKNSDMTDRLCGQGAEACIILGTTKWGVLSEVGERRAEQLSGTYCKDMIAGGSEVYKFENTPTSAWRLVDVILDRVERKKVVGEALTIQRELVNLQHLIPEIGAGKTLRYTLQQLLEIQENMVKELETRNAECNDPQLLVKLEENRSQIGKVLRQIVKDLNTPLPQVIMRLFDLTGDTAQAQVKPKDDQDQMCETPGQLKDNECRTTTTRDSGIMILLLGETGVGKSTFINVAAGTDVAEVGDGLDSCSSAVKSFTVQHPEDPTRHVVFVDTPGFNDSWQDDVRKLRQIVNWLKLRSPDMGFGGIVYLYDITQCRDSLATLVTPTTFFRPEVARNVVLATVKWKEQDHLEAQERREQQLKKIHCKKMIGGGSQPEVARFMNKRQSAWSIVDSLLARPIKLRVIQGELDTIFGGLLQQSTAESKRQGLFSYFQLIFAPCSS